MRIFNIINPTFLRYFVHSLSFFVIFCLSLILYYVVLWSFLCATQLLVSLFVVLPFLRIKENETNSVELFQIFRRNPSRVRHFASSCWFVHVFVAGNYNFNFLNCYHCV